MFQKPGAKKKKLKTKTEHEHLNLVASHGCMVCGNKNVNVHHIRESGEPRSHFKTIPLCYDHHQGPNGIHHLGKKAWYKKYWHEMDLLNKLHLAIGFNPD